MISEETLVDKIEVLETGVIQVRAVNRVLRDGAVIAQTFHRHVLRPGDDLSGEDQRVQSVALATWTPEVISAWKALQSAAQW